MDAAATRSMMRWYLLLVDGRPISMMMVMRTGEVIWVPKVAYSEAHAAHAPGIELTHRALVAAIADPEIESVNWIGAPMWLDSWRPDRMPTENVRVFARTALGRSLLWATRARQTMRRGLTAEGSDSEAAEARYL